MSFRAEVIDAYENSPITYLFFRTYHSAEMKTSCFFLDLPFRDAYFSANCL